MKSELKDRVQLVINRIRPQLQADGGDIELVDIVEGVVRARLKRACAGCFMAQMTLKR